MNDLIEALQILSKYGDDYNPTHCEHDIFMVHINPSIVSNEDKKRLKELSFHPGSDCGEEFFQSFRFGSC